MSGINQRVVLIKSSSLMSRGVFIRAYRISVVLMVVEIKPPHNLPSPNFPFVSVSSSTPILQRIQLTLRYFPHRPGVKGDV